METENKEKTEYTFMVDIKQSDLFMSPEDLKIKDNTKPSRKDTINRNYDFLFSERENDRLRKLVNKYYSHLTTKGERIKAIATGLRLRFIEKVKRFYILEEKIWETIHLLTCDINCETHKKILESLQMNPLVTEIKENNGIMRIGTTFGEIKFSEISNLFPNLEVDNDIKKLENRRGDIEKTGNCHEKAIEYSKKLKSIGISNDVVTANRSITADKISFLHSWIEFEINGKEHVLDYTQNVVMNQEGYYALNHIQKTISRINCIDIENDEKIYKQIDNGKWHIDYKTYLTCRDEIMSDLQKNIDIFHDER